MFRKEQALNLSKCFQEVNCEDPKIGAKTTLLQYQAFSICLLQIDTFIA